MKDFFHVTCSSANAQTDILAGDQTSPCYSSPPLTRNMAESFIPPRFSSSPPPFDDIVHDADSVDSYEKDFTFKSSYTTVDLDSQDDLDEGWSKTRNGHTISLNPGENNYINQPLHEETDEPARTFSDPDLDETSLHVSQNEMKIVPALPEMDLLPAQNSPSTASFEDFLGTTVNIDTVTCLGASDPEPSKSLHSHLETDACHVPDRNTMQNGLSAELFFDKPPLVHLPDSYSPRHLVNSEELAIEPAFDDFPSKENVESIPTSEVISTPLVADTDEGLASDNLEIYWIPPGIQTQQEENESVSSEAGANYDNAAEWADFADPSHDLEPPFLSVGNISHGITVVHAPENSVVDIEDEWAEFSEFSSSVNEDQKEVAGTAPPLESVPTFAKMLASAFSDNVTPPSGDSSTSQLDLDRPASDVGPNNADTSTLISMGLWTMLKNLDETDALKFHWGSSALRQALLRSLNLSYLSAFSMQRKDGTQQHAARSASNCSMLVPVKSDAVKTGILQPQQPSSIYAVPDNNSGSGASNVHLLDFLSPAVELNHADVYSSSASHTDKITPVMTSYSIPQRPHQFPPAHHISSSKAPNRNGLPVTIKQKNDVDDVIARFRNLNFMQSNVLVAPTTGPKKVSKF